MPSTNTAALARITAELRKDAARSDYEIAAVSGASQCLVRVVRRELEGSGQIAPAPPPERARRQRRPAVQPYAPGLPHLPAARMVPFGTSLPPCTGTVVARPSECFNR